jgi:hypothetical protein
MKEIRNFLVEIMRNKQEVLFGPSFVLSNPHCFLQNRTSSAMHGYLVESLLSAQNQESYWC